MVLHRLRFHHRAPARGNRFRLGGALIGWGIGEALFGAALGFTWIVVPVVVFAAVLIALIGTWFPVRSIARQIPIEVLYER